MATTSLSLSLCLSPVSSILNPKPRHSLNTHNPFLSLTSPLTSPPTLLSKRPIQFHCPIPAIPLKTTQIWKISAVSGDVLPPEANPVENSEQIVASGGDGVSTIISVLLFLAFVALSILTIGVIYIAVTDFLQKRESEKLEKEDAAKKKKSTKKGKMRARTGPRGFGQKIEEEEDD